MKQSSNYFIQYTTSTPNKYWNFQGASCNSISRLSQFAVSVAHNNKCDVFIVNEETNEVVVKCTADSWDCEVFFETLPSPVQTKSRSKTTYEEVLKKPFYHSVERTMKYLAERASDLKLSMPLVSPETHYGNPSINGCYYGHHHYETFNDKVWNKELTKLVKGVFYCEKYYEAILLAEHGWKIRREEKVTKLTNPGTGHTWEQHMWIVENY